MLAFNDPAATRRMYREEARVEAQVQRTEREQLLQRLVDGALATNRALTAFLSYETQHGREIERLLDAAHKAEAA
jgi:hypothetical protein